MKIVTTLSCFLLLAMTGFASADGTGTGPVGTWSQVDDKTGETRSLIEIYNKSADRLEGKIAKLIDPEVADPVCDACPKDDPRHGQPIEGLVILTDLKPTKEEGTWAGKIMDPENGKTYKARVWVDADEGTLKVRGYLGVFYRTQTWLPKS